MLFTTLYVSLSLSCPPSIPLATLIRFLIPISSTHSHTSVCFCLSFYQLLFLSQPTLTSPCLLKLIRPWRIGVEISSFSLNCIILLYLLKYPLYVKGRHILYMNINSVWPHGTTHWILHMWTPVQYQLPFASNVVNMKCIKQFTMVTYPQIPLCSWQWRLKNCVLQFKVNLIN